MNSFFRIRIRPPRSDAVQRRGHAGPEPQRPRLSKRGKVGILAVRSRADRVARMRPIPALSMTPASSAGSARPQAFHAVRASDMSVRAKTPKANGVLAMLPACADWPTAAPEEDPCSCSGSLPPSRSCESPRTKRRLLTGSDIVGSLCKQISAANSNGRCATGRRREPTPCLPSNAVLKTCVGPTSSNGALVVPQSPDQKRKTHHTRNKPLTC